MKDAVQAKVPRRVYSELQPNQRQGFLSASVAVITLLVYCGTVNLLILLGFASFFSWIARLALITILSTLLLPATPLLWPAFIRHSIFRTWREYFRFSFCFEEPLDPMNKRYILYELPHGVFPIGPVTACTLVQHLYPGSPVYSLAADSVFYIPIWKHFMTWIGSMPASKRNFLHLLSKGTVGVVVGGFVRVALEAGVPIVPCYFFGQSQLFNNFGTPTLARLSRRWRVAVGILIGRCGLPLPRPVPLYLVHGKPIPVQQKSAADADFEQHVDELHARAVDALKGIYLRHRDEYGWPDRPLSIE